MAIDFSDRILIIHPTAFHLGRSVVFLGLLVIAIGVVTCFTKPLLVPPMVWIALAVPTTAVGAILMGVSVTKP